MATLKSSTIETTDGTKINPYMDMYAQAASVDFNTATPTDFHSRVYLPYVDITGLTPVVILKGAVSGFTLSPERGSDGTGPYFKIPTEDLESIATDVYVGYKFNYDVELPKT